MMGRKKFALIISCFWVMLQCGCGVQKEEPIEITLMHGWGGTLQTHTVMQEIYQEFQNENPDIILTCVASSDSSIAVDNANALLSVGEIPDIVSTNGLSYYVRNAIKLGKALDLMPYIQEDPELEGMIHSQVFEIWTTDDGSVYTLPDALEVMGYWYNKDLLRRAGYAYDQGSVGLPATWDEFFEMCRRLEEVLEEDESVICLENVQVSENFFYARLRGSSELAGDEHPGLEECVGSPAFDKTVEDVGRLYGYSDNADNLETAREKFVNGKSALYFNGIWESQLLSKSSLGVDCVGFACYPTDSGQSLVYVSPSSGYLVAAHEDERKNEACIRFLKYILSEEIQKKLAIETAQAPENPKLDNETLYRENPLLGTALQIANQADIQIISLSTEWNSRAADLLSAYLTDSSESQSKLEALKNGLLASGG